MSEQTIPKEVHLDPAYVEQCFKNYVEQNLRLILNQPLSKNEEAVLLQLCRISFNAGVNAVKNFINEKPSPKIQTVQVNVRGEYVECYEICAGQIIALNDTTIIADGVLINFNSSYDI